MCIIVPNSVTIGQSVAEIWPFFDFQDGGCLVTLHIALPRLRVINSRLIGGLNRPT